MLALAVGTGLQMLEIQLAEDFVRLVGPKGRHTLPGRWSATVASPAR